MSGQIDESTRDRCNLWARLLVCSDSMLGNLLSCHRNFAVKITGGCEIVQNERVLSGSILSLKETRLAVNASGICRLMHEPSF